MEKKFTLSIGYKSVILGALTKLTSIDTIDFNLIIEEFTKKTGIKIYGEWWTIEEYKEYIEFSPNGTISLKNGLELHSEIAENYTVLDKLLNEIDPRAKEFFDDLDIKEYERRKREFLQRENVLNNINVLLISDNKEDYEGLINSGFKNIDYFKSIIRADAYFDEHPEELEKYQLVLLGNQNVQNCCFYGNVDLEKKLYRLREITAVIQVPIRRTETSEKRVIESFLSDIKHRRSWDICEGTIESFYDRVIENLLINKVLDESRTVFESFKPYVEYINPNRIIPKNKKDLKILYLDAVSVSTYALFVANELGLDITFKEDNNSSLGLYAKSHLGDYDIIIASHSYSKNILGMNQESTEQCKDTGRELTLLVTYEETSPMSKDSLGDTLRLEYSYGGNLAPHDSIKSKEMGVLKKRVKDHPELDNQYILAGYSDMLAILESAVSLYNEALNMKRIAKVKGTRFKTAEEINEEYLYALTVGEEQRRKELEPIIAFDSIRYEIINFLRNKRSRQTKRTPKDIRIIEVKGGIRVENIIGGQVVCALTFKREYTEEGLRIFTLETPTKKGTLSSPEVLGLYTRIYDRRENVPSRPNLLQMNALSSIEKKVAYAVKPINDEVWKKQNEQDSQRTLKLTNPKSPVSE